MSFWFSLKLVWCLIFYQYEPQADICLTFALSREKEIEREHSAFEVELFLNNFKMFLMNSRTSFGSRTCLPERDLNFEHTSHDGSALQNYPFPNTHSDKLTVGWGWRWKGQRFMTRVRMRFISRVRIRSISRVSVRFILRVMMRITMRVMLLMEIVILMQGPCLTLR